MNTDNNMFQHSTKSTKIKLYSRYGCSSIAMCVHYVSTEFDSKEGKLSFNDSHQILFSKKSFMYTLRFSVSNSPFLASTQNVTGAAKTMPWKRCCQPPENWTVKGNSALIQGTRALMLDVKVCARLLEEGSGLRDACIVR